jgi:tRNA pseudouridine55 synthase
MNSVIIVDKSAGWTSHDVVARMRRVLKERSIGHLGTLDPLATGVLPLLTGSLTRLAQFYLSAEKTYEGVIRFGFATSTFDAEGDRLPEHEHDSPLGAAETGYSIQSSDFPKPGLEPSALKPQTLEPIDLRTLQSLAAQFCGRIEQIPPPYSAKKIAGVPAYKLARRQQPFVLKPVPVEIKEFSITGFEGDLAHFRARVSSGTYMRSIAHEMGQRLGCGAHLASLRRTSVAEFNISQAQTLEEIEASLECCRSEAGRRRDEESAVRGEREVNGNIADERSSDVSNRSPQGASTIFVHPRQILPHLPSVTADEATAGRIRHGHAVNLPDVSRASNIKVFANQSQLLAIATRIAGTLFHPKVVFPADM